MRLVDRVLAKLGYTKPAPAPSQRFFAAGAQFNRLQADWIRAASTPDLEVRADIRILRRRARELVRDFAFARRFVNLVQTNVVGPCGIRPVPMNPGANGKPSIANKSIALAWRDWSHPENASVDARYSWPEIERLLGGNRVTDGEVFLRLWPGFDNAYGFAVELLDPDLLDEQFNREASNGLNEIRMGVEIDRFNRPIQYHFWKRYPNAPSGILNERVPIPAEEIIHLYRPLRIGQTRGISEFAPVLLDAKMLAGYQEAELVAARTAAAKMGFFVTKDPLNATGSMPPETGSGERIVMEASAGMAEELPPGMEFQPWDPQHPNAAFDVFTRAILRSMAMGLGVAYTSLTGDLSQANYSSARIGLLDERDGYEIQQEWLAEHCHRRVYRAWLKYAMLTPKLSLPSYDLERWLDVEWHARGWDWIDPLKDVQAIKEEIGIGINSRTRVLRARNIGSFEDIIAEQGNENKLAEAAKVDISGANVTVKEAATAEDVEGAKPAASSAPAKAGRNLAVV